MRTVISSNDATAMARMWIVVEPEQARGKGTGNKERRTIELDLWHGRMSVDLRGLLRVLRISSAKRECQATERPLVLLALNAPFCYSARNNDARPERQMNDLKRPGIFICMTVAALVGTLNRGYAASVDELTDLTGKATAVVTLMSRDNFSSEYRYHVSVRNTSADAFVADSLVIVLDRITNLAGEDREPLKNEPLLSRMEIVGQDGETEDGKPYFRIPPAGRPDLTSNGESPPATVRIRNRDYVAVFTPSFRVLGLRREPPKPKAGDQAASTAQSKGAATTDKLIQLLQKKGLITEEEARALKQP
jgi:hypothetical protein